jgi:hypothetical protein
MISYRLCGQSLSFVLSGLDLQDTEFYKKSLSFIGAILFREVEIMKQLYYRFYVLILLAGLLTSVKSQSLDLLEFPEKEFATPEAALQHFAESIAKNDVRAALQAFAINQQAAAFDFTAMSERLGVIHPIQTLSPAEYPMYIDLNRLALISRYGGQLKFFVYSFYATEPLGETTRIQDEPERISAFIESVNPEQLANLKINTVIRIIANSEKLLDIGQQQAKPVGADEVTELVVLYELDGGYYLGGARLLRYGESWKLDGLSSALAGMPALGTVTKTTQGDFETFISELGDNDNWKLEEVQ